MSSLLDLIPAFVAGLEAAAAEAGHRLHGAVVTVGAPDSQTRRNVALIDFAEATREQPGDMGLDPDAETLVHLKLMCEVYDPSSKADKTAVLAGALALAEGVRDVARADPAVGGVLLADVVSRRPVFEPMVDHPLGLDGKLLPGLACRFEVVVRFLGFFG